METKTQQLMMWWTRQRETEKDDRNGINFIAEEIGQLSFLSICWVEFSRCSLLTGQLEAQKTKVSWILYYLVFDSNLVYDSQRSRVNDFDHQNQEEIRMPEDKKGNWVCRGVKWESYELLFRLGRLHECGTNWDKFNICFLEQLQLVEKFTYHFRMNSANYKFYFILSYHMSVLLWHFSFLRKFVRDFSSDRWT